MQTFLPAANMQLSSLKGQAVVAAAEHPPPYMGNHLEKGLHYASVQLWRCVPPPGPLCISQALKGVAMQFMENNRHIFPQADWEAGFSALKGVAVTPLDSFHAVQWLYEHLRAICKE